jgi:hypothetical protein
MRSTQWHLASAAQGVNREAREWAERWLSGHSKGSLALCSACVSREQPTRDATFQNLL